MQTSSLGAAVTLKDLEHNQHATLHKLRPTEPICWVPVIQAWVITRRDIASEVMRTPEAFTVDHPGFSTGQVVGPSMLSLDGESHQQHRRPFEAHFLRKSVQSRFRAPVGVLIDRLLDGISAKPSAELRRDFAGPIAVETMILALGLENTPVKSVLSWYDTIVEAVTRVSAGEPVSAEGRAAFAALRDHLLPSLERSPETSLLAAASGLSTGLSPDQIISNAAVLLFGGIETTEGMIANAIYYLLENPAFIQKIQNDPELLANVVEETLRLEPAAGVVDRYAVHDVVLSGTLIRKDDLVQISLAGSNRDPAVFPDPDRFDPTRPNLNQHLTWAHGPHVCLGLHLARLECQLALQRLVQRFPNLRFSRSTQDLRDAQPRGLVFRKPQALRVRWIS
jgi:hypothetical protein